MPYGTTAYLRTGQSALNADTFSELQRLACAQIAEQKKSRTNRRRQGPQVGLSQLRRWGIKAHGSFGNS